ncbi:MAG: response regulator [Kofleriaceae bacterium]
MANERILVVDDNPTNLKLACVILEGAGYKISTAVNAAEVLALDGEVPRMVMMDIQLPDLDGLELTRRLRRDPRWSGVLIVALTAYAMKGDREKALAAGCDGYVSKPIDIEQLLTTVSKLLNPA